MTPSAPENQLQGQLQRQHGAVRRALIARHALRAAAIAAMATAAAIAIGMLLPATPATAWTRLVLLTGVVLAALVLAVRDFARAMPAWDAWLERLELHFPELRSWLRNALELERDSEREDLRPPAGTESPRAPAATHTSAELAGAIRAEAAQKLAAVRIESARPKVEAPAALARIGGAFAVVLVLALTLPQLALRSWHTLLDPGAAAPPVALTVEPGNVTISPGATLAVRARVSGSAAAPQLLGDGAAPAPQLERESGGVRLWRFDLPPVTRARDYAVNVQRTRSPNYHIGLAGEPQPVSFNVTYRAPAYARLPEQTGAATTGDLAALAGSRAHVEVTFDRDLESLEAQIEGGAQSRWSAITPRRWRGDLPIDADAPYALRATSVNGAGVFHYRISALPDAPPVITVALPSGDQDVPAGQAVPYDVLVQDDLGLGALQLQYRKDAAQPWRNVPLAGFAGNPREARVTAAWDAASLALLPGETGTFRFEVRDNDAHGGPNRATSSEFHLRFPSLADLYDKLDQKQETVSKSLEKVAQQTKEVQKSLDQLQRQQPQQKSTQPSQQFERAEEMRKTLERQNDLSKQIDAAAQQMKDHVSDAAERQAFREELQQKLKEMSELLQKIQSQEFKDALKRMQDALKQMDQREMEQSLPKLSEENKDLLKNLERSLALLKQLRQDEKMDALSQRADELKQQQDALNQKHEDAAKPQAKPADPKKDAKPNASSKPSDPSQQPQDPSSPNSQDAKSKRAEEQRQLAQKTQELAKDAEDAAKDAEDEQAKKDLQDAAKKLDQQAQPAQQAAAQQSEQDQNEEASKSGQQASQSLQQAAQQMSRSSQQNQSQKDSQNLAAVRRSAQDLVSLSRQAQQSAQDPKAGQEQADRQTDLADGVARVADSLAALSQQTPFMSPKVSQALGKAMNGLQQSGREMAQGNRARGQQSGQGAAAQLNAAVNALRETEASMCNKPGQGQSGKSGSQKMGQMGKQQSQVNRETRELAQKLSQQLRISAGDRAEMRRLADQQQRIREQLEEVQREEQKSPSLLGRLEQARKDMKDVEEQLSQGNTGGELQDKQDRILSRMLDAQRSVNRRDFDPQREAQQAQDVAHASPAPLSADLLRSTDKLKLDLLKAAADRYPAQYRALIERYLKALGGSPR
jgi:hypothetical protein